MGKRIIAKVLSVVLCTCLLYGCGRSPAGTPTDALTSTELTPTGSGATQGNGENNPDKENSENGVTGNGEAGDQNPTGGKTEKENPTDGETGSVTNRNPDVPFEFLENYKEKNVPSVYTANNENEFCCNVLLNENQEIEYYTYSEETDGYHVWRYTLKTESKEESGVGNPSPEDSGSDVLKVWTSGNGFSWVREPLSWLEGIKGEISHGRVAAFRGEDHNDYAWYTFGNAISLFFSSTTSTTTETRKSSTGTAFAPIAFNACI